jgi:hypothetical protein
MNRYIAAAAILVATAAGAAALRTTPPPLDEQIRAWMRTTLEDQSPAQHHHAGHDAPASDAPVICEVREYGHEPRDARTLADVRTIYGFHFCGVAEPGTPWDVAVKLAGPLIMTPAADPPGIQVVERTETATYAERLRQLFPADYAAVASRESVPADDLAALRRRYESAAGL